MRKIYELDKETEVELQRGWEDYLAGRVRPAKEFFAELEEERRGRIHRSYNLSGRG